METTELQGSPYTQQRCRQPNLLHMRKSPTTAPETPPRLLYSRKETGYLLSLSLRAIAYMIASGDLKTKRHGGRVMIPHAELLRQAALDDRAPIVPKKGSQRATVAVLTTTKAAYQHVDSPALHTTKRPAHAGWPSAFVTRGYKRDTPSQ
jgi:hypothetical protein